jgi:hypothetical protein
MPEVRNRKTPTEKGLQEADDWDARQFLIARFEVSGPSY